MPENRKPFFEIGRVVKKEALENLRDFPRDFADIFYQEFTDGILCGFELKMEGHEIVVCPGILKHKGNFLILSVEERLNCHIYDEHVIVKICIDVPLESADFQKVTFQVVLSKEIEIEENQYELARFKLKDGARLRYVKEYLNMKDMVTEYNTVNLVNRVYAGRKKSTFSPDILCYFSRHMLQSKTENMYDIVFCHLCLNSNRIERDSILLYIANRLKQNVIEYENDEIYEKLVSILSQVENGVKGGAVTVKNSRKTRIE